jgi:hypothetical protein
VKTRGLIDHLAGRGVRLWPSADRLEVFDEYRQLADDEWAELARRKGDILAELRRPRWPNVYPCAACGRFYFAAAGTVCYWCRTGGPEARTGHRESCETSELADAQAGLQAEDPRGVQAPGGITTRKDAGGTR